MKAIRDLYTLINRAKTEFGARDFCRQFTPNGEIETYTFEKMASDVRALFTSLNALGFRGHHIAVSGMNEYRWCVSYLTVMDRLGVVVPMPAEMPREAIAALAQKADITCAIVDDMLADNYPDNIKIVRFSQLSSLIADGNKLIDAGDTTYDTTERDPDALAKLLFTSGTTGGRRSVMLSQRNMLCIATSEFTPNIGKVTLSILPLSHGFESVCHLLSCVNEGATICFAGNLRRFPASFALFGVESVFLVPALAEAMLYRFPADLEKAAKTLKNVICGGAPVGQHLVNAYAARGMRLFTGYGLSECAPLVTLNTNMVEGSCGQTAGYCEIRVSAEGEIEVKGENVMSGYYKNPEDTQSAFTADGWLKTGDLGRIDGDGNLFLTGRIKNLIILSNGENVSPEELEDILKQRVSPVQEALVFAKDDLLTARVYLGENPTDKAIETVHAQIKAINQTLPGHMRIMSVEVSPTPLPLNATGKLIRS